jgi:hypothetical protein
VICEQYDMEWEKDAVLPADDLDTAARNVYLLHAKWWRYHQTEKAAWKKADHAYQVLRRQKHDWYAGKMDDAERKTLGWAPWGKALRLRDDIERHMRADLDLQQVETHLAALEEMLRFLEDVIKAINSRGYQIKNTIDYLKFKMGV